MNYINSVMSRITLRIISYIFASITLVRLAFGIASFQQIFARPDALETPLPTYVGFILSFFFLLYISFAYFFLLIKKSSKSFEEKLHIHQRQITTLLVLAWIAWIISGQVTLSDTLLRPILRDVLVLHTILLFLVYSTTPQWEKMANGFNNLFHWDESNNKINKFDVLVYIILFIFGVLSFMGYWKGIFPFTKLSSDAANIASFSAGRSYPELFTNDAILGDIENFGVYFTFYMPFLEFTEKIVGGFGMASVLLYAPQTMLQGIGFYLLGKEIYNNRFWAASLASFTYMWTQMNLGTFWGIDHAVIPRTTLQACLPFVLFFAIKWRNKPQRWPLVMFFTGLLAYIHPVSAPVWGVAIFLGLWFSHPPSWSFQQRIKNAALNGGVFALTIMPFAIHYLSTYSHGVIIDYQQVFDIMSARFAKNIFNPPMAALGFAQKISSREPLLLYTGLVGIPLTLFAVEEKNKKKFQIIFWWIVGIAIVAIIIPTIDHTIAKTLQRLPYQVDLTRNMRYFYPILAMFSISGILSIPNILKRFDSPIKENFIRTIPLIALLFVVGFLKFHKPVHATRAIKCLRNGDLYCPIKLDKLYQQEVLKAVKYHTAEGSRILPVAELALSTRYYALRPVVHAWKDGGIISYDNSDRLVEWYETALEMREIIELSDNHQRSIRFVALSRELSSDYIIIDWNIDELWLLELNIQEIYSNEGYTLLEVH